MADGVNTSDFDAFEKAMRKAPAALYGELRRSMPKWMLTWFGQFKRSNVSGGAKGVKTRSGFLRRSTFTETRGTHLGDLRILAGFTAPYAPIQEFGGVVTPVKGKYLTIPLDAAKTPAGVTRKPAREWENTFFLNRAGKGPILMQRTSSGLVPLFVLVKSVRLSPKLGFHDAWAQARRRFMGAVGKAARLALAKTVRR